jgi:hypothetical protein
VTDGKFILAFFLSKIFFQIFWSETKIFPYKFQICGKYKNRLLKTRKPLAIFCVEQNYCQTSFAQVNFHVLSFKLKIDPIASSFHTEPKVTHFYRKTWFTKTSFYHI